MDVLISGCIPAKQDWITGLVYIAIRGGSMYDKWVSWGTDIGRLCDQKAVFQNPCYEIELTGWRFPYFD